MTQRQFAAWTRMRSTCRRRTAVITERTLATLSVTVKYNVYRNNRNRVLFGTDCRPPLRRTVACGHSGSGIALRLYACGNANLAGATGSLIHSDTNGKSASRSVSGHRPSSPVCGMQAAMR